MRLNKNREPQYKWYTFECGVCFFRGHMFQGEANHSEYEKGKREMVAHLKNFHGETENLAGRVLRVIVSDQWIVDLVEHRRPSHWPA